MKRQYYFYAACQGKAVPLSGRVMYNKDSNKRKENKNEADFIS